MDADAIVVGGGLAGLVATCELIEAGRKVILLDQEGEQSLGGQAFWSFGGLFFVDSPEQRRMRIRDSRELALQDWMGSAGFDRPEDLHPRKWAEAYVDFAAGEKRSWLHARGVRWFPIVGWAERGGYTATEHGNSVPRFHVTWGTGPGIIAPFVARVREGAKRGLVSLRFRHHVNAFTSTGGVVDGVAGDILEPTSVERGRASSRTKVGEFALEAQAIIVTSGGIGGDLDLVRQSWPKRLGTPPARMICGVPDHVDGRMLAITEAAGGAIINRDRMWHYTEGIENWSPIWTRHGIRILPGPSSMWFDARGRRLPVPLFPGFDTLGTLAHIMQTGHDYSWFVLSQKIIEREFALSGSEQNPDLTSGSWLKVIRSRRAGGAPPPVRAFMEKGADFIVERNLGDLVARMNKLTGDNLIDTERAGAPDHGARPRDRQRLHQGRAGDGHPRRPQLPGRQADPGGQAAPAARSGKRPADRGATLDPDAQDAGRPAHGPFCARAEGRRLGARQRVRCGRGRGLRRRRHARLPRAGGHLPGRLHLLRAHRGAGGCGGRALTVLTD